ncbi:mannosyl-3-phosphoglycerate phosphatase [Nereida sp. MMG025]|uniref:HAD-IIB family hydrolase n=1 Tax=Nereida sp. MMG025 TaxID=2909981 RepID=UPI001F02E9E4|nr:HAD-IIB family hydrolase [Nereida sp. MMG025]MCF6445833.1 HAD-IIB family hydrolase [Nereida sp. MMG025]
MPLLVFTDLDGTLLSHADYQCDAASSALERLASIGAGVVMASSKTASEICLLRNTLRLQNWPAIVENGAGLLEAHAQPTADGAVYAKLRARLEEIPHSLRRNFQGFGDLDVAEIAELTELTLPAAALAKERAFSEPGVWRGSQDEKAAFLDALKAQGLSARSGGRFLTVSFGQTKADRMAQIIDAFAPRHTIALGDAPNDIEMLEAADFGVIVANPHRTPLPPLAAEKCGRVIRTTQAGPEGWNTAIIEHLERLKL